MVYIHREYPTRYANNRTVGEVFSEFFGIFSAVESAVELKVMNRDWGTEGLSVTMIIRLCSWSKATLSHKYLPRVADVIMIRKSFLTLAAAFSNPNSISVFSDLS